MSRQWEPGSEGRVSRDSTGSFRQKKTAPREGVRSAILVVELVEGTTKSQGRKRVG
jgi:hypothetical protein